MSKQRVPTKVVEAAVHSIRKRFKGAEMAAEMEGFQSHYEAMMLYIDEIGSMVMQINEDGLALEDSAFTESLSGIKLALLTTIQLASLGLSMMSDIASQYSQMVIGAEKSFIESCETGQHAKVVSFLEEGKKFYMPDDIPEAVKEGFKRVEERIKDKDISPEMIAQIVREELGDIAELRNVHEVGDIKKATTKGNGTLH